jgi:hypothetical protein
LFSPVDCLLLPSLLSLSLLSLALSLSLTLSLSSPNCPTSNHHEGERAKATVMYEKDNPFILAGWLVFGRWGRFDFDRCSFPRFYGYIIHAGNIRVDSSGDGKGERKEGKDAAARLNMFQPSRFDKQLAKQPDIWLCNFRRCAAACCPLGNKISIGFDRN